MDRCTLRDLRDEYFVVRSHIIEAITQLSASFDVLTAKVSALDDALLAFDGSALPSAEALKFIQGRLSSEVEGSNVGNS